jgi:hypothetical protein
MGNRNYVSVINVRDEYKDGAWIFTSENLPGLFLAGSDLNKLREDVPVAIKALYQLNYGMTVDVRLTGEPGELVKEKRAPQNKWAAVPVAA